MLGKAVFCAGCLVAQGLAPAAAFAGVSQAAVIRRQQLCSGRSGGLFHADGKSSSISSGASLVNALVPPRSKSPTRCHGSVEAAEEETPHPGSLPRDGEAPKAPASSAPAGRCSSSASTTAISNTAAAQGCADEADDLCRHAATTRRQQQTPFLARSVQTLFVGAALACSVLLTCSVLPTTSPAYADSSQQQEQQQQQLMFGLVEPRPPFPGRVRPPPPEIPEGRITIAQWCEKNIGRRLPKVGDIPAGVKIAADNAENIRGNSGAAPTAQELRGVAGQAVEGKLGEFFAAARGGSPKATISPDLLTSASSEGLQEAEAPISAANIPSPSQDPSLRQEIDALKAEMLKLQSSAPPAETPTPATSGVPSKTAPATAKTPRSPRPPTSFFKIDLPRSPPGWSFRLGMPPATTTSGAVDGERVALSTDSSSQQQGVTTMGRSAAEEAETLPSPPPRTRAKKRERPRRSDTVSSPKASTLVDLKTELRAESERAATNTPPSSSSRRQRQEASPEAAVAAKYVAPAPLYEPPAKTALTALESPFTAKKGFVGGVPEAGGSSGSSESAGGGGSAMGLEGVTAAARTSLEKLEIGGLSEKVKDLADKSGSASEDGVAAVLEQGRATVDRLQAEAERISTDALNTAAVPVAEKLSTLPETAQHASQLASSRASQLSTRAASELSSSAARLGDGLKGGVGGAVAAGAAAAGGVSEALRRGPEGLLALEIGRAVRDKVSALSRSGVDGMPALGGQVAALTSQMVDTSSRAISQVAGGAGGISQKILRAISGGLSNVGSDLREVDFSARAKSVLEQLPSLGRNLASGALTVAETVLSILRRLSAGSVFADGRSNPNADLEAAAAAVAVGVAMAGGAATFGRGGNSGSGGGNSGIVEEGRGVGGSGGEDEGRRLQPIGGSVAGGGGASQGEERMLQPVGVKLETGAAPSEDVRYGREAVSASSTLWDMIRDSGTGAGDSVREVSEEDLLERAAQVGEKLRETAEGLKVLRHEVLALRESIRESDLEGRAKAIRERLASTLEGSVAD